jgi:UDP-2-acetamido-2-deoxy-ribo-hexuluronate aminotransferase
MQFIDLGAQQRRIRASLDSRMAKVLEHGQYILGPEVAELECDLARRAGVKHCIGVANGTDAIQLALMALGIGPGDEVITPAFSYIAAAEVIVLLGAVPVFVDVDPISYNVDPVCVAAAITHRTRAIIPVDLFGQCADYHKIAAIAADHGIPIVEDAAQSFGAHYRGRQAGALGCIATTSFFPSKPLGCYGDGGACFTDDDNLAMLLRSIRAHGQAQRYYHVRVGVNARLDTLQAAILLAKLEVYDDEITLREAVAQRYHTLIAEARLDHNGIVVPVIGEEQNSVWAQYTIRTPRRADVMKKMAEAGVPTTIHYPRALHQQEVFANSAKVPAPVLQSERAADEVLSLPMHPYLVEEEQRRVVDALIAAVEAPHP